MEHAAIERRDDGSASVFIGGRHYERERIGPTDVRWLKRTRNIDRPVSSHRARRLESIYQHPESAKRVLRFPREKKPSAPPIKNFFDIPVTTEVGRQKLRWLVKGVFPESELILITGLPGSFKSFLAEYLAAAVSEGRDFLGRRTKRRRVLILDRDNPLHIIAERRRILNLAEGEYFKIWGTWVDGSPPDIDDPRLEQFARDHRPLIIFDSLVRFHDGDENSSKDMATVMAKLRKLVTLGATVIVLHHSPKSSAGESRYRGSSDIHASVDVAFNLSVDRKRSPAITMACFKMRGAHEFTLTIRPDFERNCFELISESSVQDPSRDTDTLRRLIRETPGIRQSDLITGSGLPERRVRRLLREGIGKLWSEERHSRKTKAYSPLQQNQAVADSGE